MQLSKNIIFGVISGIVATVVLWGVAGTAPSTFTPKPDLGPNADMHGYRLFPDNDPWNQDISQAKVDPLSNAIITSIGPNRPLHPDFGTVWNGAPSGIPYVVVGKDQPNVKVTFDEYGDESDPGPYAMPKDCPIEGGDQSDGDRHVLVVNPFTQKLYELWHSRRTPDGWVAGSGAIFDLGKPSAQRKPGITSADAAGLPILPGLVRYDEVVGQGAIKHALRFTVQKSRRAYVPPALHWAARSNDPHLPPMGMRVRLKANVDISHFPATAQVILQALKTYGMILADNGSNWFISGAPNPNWNEDDLHTLSRIHGSDLEVIEMKGLTADK